MEKLSQIVVRYPPYLFLWRREIIFYTILSWLPPFFRYHTQCFPSYICSSLWSWGTGHLCPCRLLLPRYGNIRFRTVVPLLTSLLLYWTLTLVTGVIYMTTWLWNVDMETRQYFLETWFGREKIYSHERTGVIFDVKQNVCESERIN